MSTLSFHETKNVSCGEGGALIVNDPALVARVEVLRETGTDRSRFFRGEVDKYTWTDIGSSYRLPVVPAHCAQPSHLFYLLLPSLEERQALIAHLKRRSVHAVFHYLPMHLSEMGPKLGGRKGDCPVTEDVSDRLVRLPLFSALTADEVRRVVDAVSEF